MADHKATILGKQNHYIILVRTINLSAMLITVQQGIFEQYKRGG